MSPGLEAGRAPLAAAAYLWEQTPYLSTAIPRLVQSAARPDSPCAKGEPWLDTSSLLPSPSRASSSLRRGEKDLVVPLWAVDGDTSAGRALEAVPQTPHEVSELPGPRTTGGSCSSLLPTSSS